MSTDTYVPSFPGSLTLPEAIRRGAQFRPQNYGSYFRERTSCALGAAAEAISYEVHDMVHQWGRVELGLVNRTLLTTFPALRRRSIPVNTLRDLATTPEQLASWTEKYGPKTGSHPCGPMLIHAIAFLNDEYHWTREQIADWVEIQTERLTHEPTP